LNQNSTQILLILLCMIFVGLSSCKKEEQLSCDEALFGIPNERTGLSQDVCQPVCGCKSYTPRAFSPADISALREWELTNPMEALESNPYDDPVPAEGSGICAIIVEDAAQKLYRLQNFENEEAAESAGAILTHHGPCGLCSSLEDLAVYLEYSELGTLVRLCAAVNLNTPFSELEACIEGIGFSNPCASIWAYNAKNTQQKCADPCIQELLNEIFLGEITPYNNPDGSLSPCIACDEEISGPIFKAFAARTRRNSGLPSGICRFCDGVLPVKHDYPL